MKTLSVIIITKNEEKNLEECINSLDGIAHEIVVVDYLSSDSTPEIAKRLGAKFHATSSWHGFGNQKNIALSLASMDWILSLDADERLTPELCTEISNLLVAETESTAFELSRLSSFCGEFIHHSGWSPDYVLRLFKRGTAKFSPDLVHERVIAQGKVGKLNSKLIHYSYKDYEQVIHKLNQYTSASAAQMLQKGQTSNIFKAIGHGGWAFVRSYLLRGGFLDGSKGFALAFYCAEVSYYKQLKLALLSDAAQASRACD
jgi:glycosyltransferase involved in cell wall biosynthesis